VKGVFKMPGFDGTGPEGRGPFGRRLGPCAEGDERGLFFFRRGRRGGGRGYRWFNARNIDVNPDLEAEKRFLERRLDAINQMIGKSKEEE